MSDTQVTFIDVLSEKKETLKVLILGDYSKKDDIEASDDVCERQLRMIKDRLKQEGYKETYLVADFPDEEGVPSEAYPEHFLKKSFHYIDKWADVCLFVLLKEGDHQSVVREWGHMMDVSTSKCSLAILLYHSDVRIRLLLQGDLRGQQITNENFENIEEIVDRISALVFTKMYQLV